MEKENIVQFSGGKDSTCMLLLMLEKGMPVDEIIFCDTGKEFPQMYEHIKKVNAYIKEHYNKEITIVKAAKSFDYYFLEQQRSVKSKYHHLKGYGWPSFMRRWCTSNLKVAPCNKYLRGRKYNSFIGIAADEQKRVKPGINYPLIEWGMTEKDCLEYCYAKGYTWGGLYNDFKRVSCYLCPLKRIQDWRTLRAKYPELWAEALRLDSQTCYNLRPNKTLHDYAARFDRER